MSSLVVVVGAGASKEVGLPDGATLKKLIKDFVNVRFGAGGLVSGDELLAAAFCDPAVGGSQGISQDIVRVTSHIRDAMPQAISIDNFIDCHRNDELLALCGKIAIARCILSEERRSPLFVNPSDRALAKIRYGDEAVESSWLNAFFQQLTENCQFDEVAARLREVTIICFNYDRCIEHFFHESLQNYYGVSSQQASDLLNELRVFHPYGLVGNLPWQKNVDSIKFGDQLIPQQLIRQGRMLRTFTEETDHSANELNTIRNEVVSAQRLLFVGFAFHRLNLKLLFGELYKKRVASRSALVYATAFGISDADIDIIKGEIARSTGIQIPAMQFRPDLKAGEIFSQYSRALGFP